MTRSLLVAAFVGSASAARIARKRSANRIGTVPVFGEAASAEGNTLVYFDPKTPDAEIESFCAGKCIYRGHPDAGGLPFAVMEDDKAMETSVLAHQGMVQSVEHDGEMLDDEMMIAPDNAGSTWGTERVGRSRARGGGEGVNIYVMDSGVRVTHNDFGGRAIATLDAMTMPPKVCVAGDTRCAADGRGHGSHCAGSAGGAKYGVAPRSTIRAMNRGRGFADAFASMDWMATNYIAPAVLTMSFGSAGQTKGSTLAVDTLVAAGVTVTVSAGNNNYDACRKTFAFIPSAIVVGSTDSMDKRSSFSNYGSCITIFAPGTRIPSADYRSDSGERIMSGTSMSTPHVAGGVAVLLSVDPTLSPAKVRERLLDSADVDKLTDVLGSPNLMLNIGA